MITKRHREVMNHWINLETWVGGRPVDPELARKALEAWANRENIESASQEVLDLFPNNNGLGLVFMLKQADLGRIKAWDEKEELENLREALRLVSGVVEHGGPYPHRMQAKQIIDDALEGWLVSAETHRHFS